MINHNDIDNILISRLQKGDEDTFAILFKKYYVQLCRYALIFLKDRESSEEVVMALFTDIWEKRTGLGNIRSVKSYLFRAVRNRCLNWIRNKKDQVEIDDSVAGLLYYDTSLEFLELNRLIEEAITSLPDRCRTVFLSSRRDNMTNKEIAEYMDISAKTVEAQITKALKVISKHIAVNNQK